MINYKYLVIGGGIAADNAVAGIREKDADGAVGIISNEPFNIYNRPPLTKGLWKGDSIDSVWRPPLPNDVVLHKEKTAMAIDPAGQVVTDAAGEKYRYEKLLLATGGNPRKVASWAQEIIYYRTFADYNKVRATTEWANDYLIIGSGFIGSEMAAALCMQNKNVTMVFPDTSIGSKIYPADLADFITAYYTGKGVTIVKGEKIDTVIYKDKQFEVKTGSGRSFRADVVIAGLGITPNMELAQNAGLDTDNGITVNAYLQTKHPHIYAVGDVANYYCPILEKRRRVEHEDNSNAMGLMAGKNMAGGTNEYVYLPMFYSDLFELGYEAVGELDSSLETVSDWKTPHREGVIYYLRENRVKGILLWNTWGQVDHAREIIQSKKAFEKNKLMGLLPV